MESNRKASKDGQQYNHLFPKANLTDHTVKRRARLEDTIKFIPKVVNMTRWQTEKFADFIKGNSVYETCRNIWEFIYPHVGYHKDDDGLEQVRSPARLWHDRFRGVDCDCFSVFISTVLTNLKIPHKLRITKYKQPHFQHIYPIVPTGKGKYITIDCVVHAFNYEEPYTEKIDTNMNLEYLDGLGEQDELLGEEEIGKLFNWNLKDKLKKVLKKVSLKNILNTVNKFNPATVVLRNGLLAAMKLNVFMIAQRIKWGYLTEEQAKAKRIDMGKWRQMVGVREKMESIFFGAGGKPENLKKAILTGQGNTNKEVAGLFGIMPDKTVFELNENTPLPQLIGNEIWHSENVEGIEGFEGLRENDNKEELGAVALAAVSGALAAVAALLKSIGNIFPGKEQGSEDFANTTKADNAAIEKETLPVEIKTTAENAEKLARENSPNNSAALRTSDQESKNDTSNSDNKSKGFWEKNKKWLKPTLWGVGGLGVLTAGYHFMKGKSTEQKPPATKALSGLKSKKKKKQVKKKTISLL